MTTINLGSIHAMISWRLRTDCTFEVCVLPQHELMDHGPPAITQARQDLCGSREWPEETQFHPTGFFSFMLPTDHLRASEFGPSSLQQYKKVGMCREA